MSKTELAAQLLKDALALGQELGDVQAQISALRGLGHVLSDTGDIVRAKTYYEAAVSLARNQDDRLVLAHALRHLADACRHKNDAEAAETFYDESIALYCADDEASSVHLANALRGSARLYEKRDSERAIALWKEAARIYQKVGIDAGVEEANQAIVRCRSNGTSRP